MTHPTWQQDDAIELLVAEATDKFIESLQGGAAPEVEEFAGRYPAISGILRELLPALRVMQGASAQTSVPLGCLGDFRLIREIGRGGMGVVYEAEQISLVRRVALKVLPLAAALDPRQLERFRLEAQAAAQLHHSNIVPVYSVGCERGVYYYAMQFIEGRSLAEVIVQLAERESDRSFVASPKSAVAAAKAAVSHKDVVSHGDAASHSAAIERAAIEHGAASRPTVAPHESPASVPTAETVRDFRGATADTQEGAHNPARFRRVAALGIQAAEALEHAHSMGIIHRDIKPANLLLDAASNLYITDFGLARLQGSTGLTITGGLAGTLRYMSPEQVLPEHGGVDHRTDIYSLGATLYELLTLLPAFTAADRHVLLREIGRDEPVAPRQRNKAIPVDLETIVLKAMAKEPAVRYATAQELAADLRRFLEHRPIAARRPTMWETAVKWTRRHRGVAASAVGVLLIAAIGFAVSTALVVREQWKTQAAYEAEARQRTRAEQSLRQARQIVDFMTEVSEEELSDKPELQGLRRVLLAGALEYYQKFIEQGSDDPSLQAQLVASHVRIAGILDEIGSTSDALAALERARALQEKLLRGNPAGPDMQRGFLSIYSRFGSLHGGRELNLLSQKSVEDDLKLSDEQVSKISAILDKRRPASLDSRNLSVKEWQAKFAELATQQAELTQLLTPKQSERFRQIVLQQRGTEAFSDPAIAKTLNLSHEQIEQIHNLREEARRLLWASARPGEAHADSWTKVQDSWRKTSEKILAVLTDEQRTQWQQLTGEPFKGKIRPPHWGPRRSWHGA